MYQRFMSACVVVALSIGFGITGTPKADDSKNIQGIWRIVSADGPDKVPPDALKKLSIKITADRIVFQSEGKEISAATYKLNPKKPAEIDLVVKVLIDKVQFVAASDEPRLGIYELKGDDLKICVALALNKKTPNPEARPTELKATGDIGILTLKRNK